MKNTRIMIQIETQREIALLHGYVNTCIEK